MPAWPIAVPNKPIAFSTPSHGAPNLETETDSGRTRSRPISTERIRRIAHTYKLTPVEYAAFDTWLFTDLGNGSAEFTKDVYDGKGCATKTARIVGGSAGVTAEQDGGVIIVSMTLEVIG